MEISAQASLLRSAGVRVLLPRGPEETDAMNRTGLIVVTAYTRKAEDLPLAKLHFIPAESSDKKVLALPRAIPGRGVGRIRGAGEDKDAFMEEAFYFVPLELLSRQGAIAVWFKDKDSPPIPLLKLPFAQGAEHLSKLPASASAAPDPARAPNLEAVFRMIIDEPCVPVGPDGRRLN